MSSVFPPKFQIEVLPIHDIMQNQNICTKVPIILVQFKILALGVYPLQLAMPACRLAISIKRSLTEIAPDYSFVLPQALAVLPNHSIQEQEQETRTPHVLKRSTTTDGRQIKKTNSK